ncbi:NOL1/NOP2/Sun domain member 3 [Apophysomyces ossiformis]|uniref:NOL1/NOP2/Sun domain family member 4 n=1 Tax=Apophysomyces ossiformis TaxID=679940 RepID=A0A8H7BV49_9FUNG|nr:NOL1/NOP2/Sun domain member 3 [Apophysomyces ossiformis]
MSPNMEDDNELRASPKPHDKHQQKSNTEKKGKSLSKSKEKALQREQERLKAVTAAFNKFYENEWGDRWPDLLNALNAPVRHCLMVNKYADPEDVKAKLETIQGLERLPYLSIPCFASNTGERYPPPSKDRTNRKDYFILDAGSVLATEALDIQPDDRVLDLCAAPGGKSLAILQRLENYGSLTSNEISQDRRRRLRQVMDDYLPAEMIGETITVTGKDGTQWYGEPEQYDKVLLDAPCSSERHLLHDKKEFEQWSPKRTVVNAKRQLSLLKAAVHSVRVGGYVLYGTCSISSVENDKVIKKMVRKGKIPVEVIKQRWPMGEKTKYGWIVLPDKTDGWGPLYFSLLRRTGVSKEEEEAPSEDEEE